MGRRMWWWVGGLVVGGKGLQEGKVEIKWRTEAEATKVDVASGVQTVGIAENFGTAET